jgi:hypothetical protein
MATFMGIGSGVARLRPSDVTDAEPARVQAPALVFCPTIVPPAVT